MLHWGCTTNPQVRVQALERVATGLHADEYALRIDIRNPTERPLVLDRWNYTVRTPTQSWSTEWIASRTLPPRSVTFETLPVVLQHADLSSTESTWRVDGTLQYLLPGQLAETLFDLGVSRPDVSFAASGETLSTGNAAPAVNQR